MSSRDRDKIIMEICRMNHRILGILENDCQIDQVELEVNPNQAATSHTVNSEPIPEQVQRPQLDNVSNVVDNDRGQEMSPIQKRAKTMIVKKKQLRKPEENLQENNNEKSNESSQINDDNNRENPIIVKTERLEVVNTGLNSSEPMNFQLCEFQNHPRVAFQNTQPQMALNHRTIGFNDLEFDLLETGRLIRGRPYVNIDIRRLIYTLMRRFSKFEKPNGGSFYFLYRGMYVQGNGDCVQKVSCYGHRKHSCPVFLTIDYKHDNSVYKLYKSGTHNHDLNHVETLRSKQMDTFEDIKIEIISSKIAD